jgi:hypothetical protein
MPPIPIRPGGKRPVWLTILMIVAAGGLWFAQQKGWISKSSSSTQQTSSQSDASSQNAPNQTRSSQPSTSTSSNTSASKPVEPTPEVKAETRSKPSNQQAATQTRPAGTVNADDIDDSEVENMTARERAERPPVAGDQIDELFKQEKTLIWVEGTGKVTKLLADDTEGAKHQKFLMKTADGHEVMVAHNIDLSPRVPAKEGDSVKFRGEYIWTERGGKVHFTHKPQYGGFKGGWIELGGKKYE